MTYNEDRPIEREDQDLLGRVTFSRQVGKAIFEYSGKSGLVLGLFGKWGTGKTSVINLAEREIHRLAKNDNNKPLVMRFSPWNYSDQENLISLFFKFLITTINSQGNKQMRKQIGKALVDYAEAFDALSLVPVVGSGLAVIFKTIAKARGRDLMQAPDLDKARNNLEQVLISFNKKIVIVIDDIDRLTNSQIRDIFQLVKQVADFPNIIYVLVMDRDVVCRALTDVHNVDGHEYLEKIIQVPLELPDLRKDKLHQILFSKLDQIVDAVSDKRVLDDYWGKVFVNCIRPYINNLRDVNRLVNIFQFKYGVLSAETSIEDLLAITTLEVLQPELYKWVRDNKDAVCGSPMHGLLMGEENRGNYRAKYTDEFTRMGIDPDVAINCLSTLFPIFSDDINNYQYSSQSSLDIRSKMRVACAEKFDLYFMFDLEEVEVSRNTINACIFELNQDKLIEVVEEINREGKIVYFLEELRSLVDKIPYERLGLIAFVLLLLHGDFEGENSRLFFPLSAVDTANHFIEALLKKLNTDEERYSIISSGLGKVRKNGLGTIARIIDTLELAYGRREGSPGRKENQIISLAHLKNLESEYVERIRAISSTESILGITDFSFALDLWESLDEEEASNYLASILKDKVVTLKFICSLCGKWYGTSGEGWSFYMEAYEKYIPADDVYGLIQTFAIDNLNQFSEDQQIKLASFVLQYENVDGEHTPEKQARELVNKWKAK